MEKNDEHLVVKVIFELHVVVFLFVLSIVLSMEK
jgi:hypothetical protein